MQTVINWTRYDGTPETLPGEGKLVLVHSEGRVSSRALGAGCLDGGAWFYLHRSRPIEIGDLWAPWPDAPQGVE